jgi:hypothetical protein
VNDTKVSILETVDLTKILRHTGMKEEELEKLVEDVATLIAGIDTYNPIFIY